MAASDDAPISLSEAAALFKPLTRSPGIVIAVSGGPDSTALLWLAAQWHRKLGPKAGPPLAALTVDHGLRPESAREAREVAGLARRLGVPHKTLRWTGAKPATGLPEAARLARYALLAQAARALGAGHVLTAHTRDDQAETVLMRMMRGSGLTGLGAMRAASPLGGPAAAGGPLLLVRPLLGVPKARLVATLRAAGIGFADDPTNRDPRFTRPRLRALAAALEREGLGATRLATLAFRLRRADEAIEIAVDAAQIAVSRRPWTAGIAFEAALFDRLPAEIALRLLGRAVAFAGDAGAGPIALGKLEALLAGVGERRGALRRSLAGALVTCRGDEIRVETAPPRRPVAAARPGPARKPGPAEKLKPASTKPALTTPRRRRPARAERR